MQNTNLKSILKFYAVSPIHAGSGDSTATVDLPIQRERHTNWPLIHSSGVKGSMRDHYRNFNPNKKDINFIFGSDDQDQWEDIKNEINKDKNDKEKIESSPGAFSVSDAKLLAFPMRSNISPFVWVTSSAILKRLANDLKFAGINEIITIEEVKEDKAKCVIGQTSGQVILEDAIVNVEQCTGNYDIIKNKFKEIENLILISDEMFDYCVTCTEIQTNIKIDSETGTASPCALRYQEFLPADTVLYSVVYYGNQNINDIKAEMIKKYIEETIKDFIQVGGDETLGKGICKIEWINGGVQ